LRQCSITTQFYPLGLERSKMSEILVLRKINSARFVVYAGSIVLLTFSLFLPITMFSLHPVIGLFVSIIYSYLAYRVFFKHDFFKEKIHSIDVVNNKIVRVRYGFFKFHLTEQGFENIANLVLEKNDIGIPVQLRCFELSALIDGKETLLARNLIRKTINTITKDISREFNLSVSFSSRGLKNLDSDTYSFENLDNNYSYSPGIYLLNGIIYLCILPFCSFLTYALLPIIIWLFINYFKSRRNLNEIVDSSARQEVVQ